MSHHFKRVITSFVAVPFLIALTVYSSPEIFSLFMFFIIEVAVWEYNILAFGRAESKGEKREVYFFSTAIILAAMTGDLAIMMTVVIFSFLLASLFFILRIRDGNIDTSRMGQVILGFLYMPLLMSSFILLRNVPDGIKWIFFTLTLAFCGDMFGFYTGRLLGKRKLHAAISPGKTVEGAIGLIVGSMVGGFIFQQILFRELPLTHALLLAFFGGILGQLGDLFESALKRAAGVKDAGLIFPGHGGMMDRLDSISFIVPLIYYYQNTLLK